MKKVLALIVAFALCFTAFAGCFATSAAQVKDYTFSISAATDDLTSAGGNVVVTVSGKYTTIDTAQYLVVTLPANVEFVSVAGGEDISKVDNPTEETVILYAFDEAANQIKFLEAYDPNVDFAIEITVTVPEYSAEAYEYVIEANAQVAAFDAASSEDITTIEDSVTITVPAPVVEPEEPVCEHVNAEWELTNVTETHFEYDAATCPDCDAVDVEKDVEIGEPLATPLTPSRSIDPANDISFLVGYLITDTASYSNLTLVVDKEVYTKGATEPGHKTMYITEYAPFTDPTTKKEYNRFVIADIAGYEMNNNVDFAVYGLNEEGEMICLSSTTDFSVKFYAMYYINAVNQKHPLITALVDMLNYGSYCQIYGDFNATNLANADLTGTQKTFGTLESDYISKAETEFTVVNKVVDGDTTTAAGQLTMSKSLKIESKVNVQFIIWNTVKGDINNYYCMYEYYTPTGIKTFSQEPVQYAGDTFTYGQPCFTFDMAPVSIIDYPVTAKIYYGNPNEDGKLVSTVDFNIEAYVANYVDGNDVALSNMLKAMYAYSRTLSAYANVNRYTAG